jgi:hypothetical protein
MSIPMNWHCPHCHHKVTITDDRNSSETHFLLIKNRAGKLALSSHFLVCPNDECQEATLWVELRTWERRSGEQNLLDVAETWQLIPKSDARPFPDYVPAPIREDYTEACCIRALSPKSAATLARRSLQGILRDFYRVKPGRLVDEINALKDTLEPDLWDAIDGVRQVGNMGAHMEADINVIVDVDPEEAQILIRLVETMIEETYVHREQRRARIKQVTDLAAAKDGERRQLKTPAH